ncbi:phenylalanine--tRNA ligase subunit beta [Candidatus Nomurabacteria bacterium]|nr:phenylalanine--tRNA ligase subunit beta [Candidatus Nomurabacteria bacterium]
MKISYNWLKRYIPEVPYADKLTDIFNYHLCEMESMERLPPLLSPEGAGGGDYVFDIKVLPNRAHDLLSHLGVARELASLLNIKFVDPAPKYKIPEVKPTKLQIKIETEKCRRYMGRIIRGVKVGPSPEWMVKHLESMGQRSINNIVDAANIVMFDDGQPTHCFDLDKMENVIFVREATGGESLTTLDNKEIKLKNSNMVIADTKNALAIAGVKGGKIAEVDNNTKDIILEVANFDPTSVRKTAQAVNIITDAKKRFENDLSPELCGEAMVEFSALIAEMCPEAIFEEVVDVYPQKQEERKLSFSTDKISKILGLEVSVEEIKDILKRYNFEYTENAGKFEITVPTMRLDLVIEEDMAEEIGRILGYDKVKVKISKINFQPKQNQTYTKILWTRNKLLNDGYSEVMNSSFRSMGEVSVLASASDKKFLRTNLTDGLKESLKLNQANAPLLGMNEIKIFEIGTIFKKDKEEMHVAYANKKEIKEMKLDEFCIDSPLEEYPLGGGGKIIHPGTSATPQEGNNKFKPWSLFPFIARDIAVWVPDTVESEKVYKVIKENAGDMVIRGPELFDEFKKDGKISYAFRLVFQSFDRTLTDTEVNDIMTKITNKIKENADWQVR